MAFTNAIGNGNMPGNNTLIAPSPNFDPSLSSNSLIIGEGAADTANEILNSAIIGVDPASTAAVIENATVFGYNTGAAATDLENSTIIGSSAASTGTSYINSTLVGFSAGFQASGDFCTGIGSLALSGTGGTGGYHTALGYNAGSAMTGSETSNVYIANVGASESNTTRIGTDGDGINQQNQCYIAGNVTPIRNLALEDSAGVSGPGGYTATAGCITRITDFTNLPVLSTFPATAGTMNIFLAGAGNFFMSGTTGANIGAGYNALSLLNNGSYNTALGYSALSNIDCSYSVGLGYLAGSNNSSGDSNIYILNLGDFSESNTTRIGTDGTGNAQQTRCFLAGNVQPSRSLDLLSSNGWTNAYQVGAITQNGATIFHTAGTSCIYAGINAGNPSVSTTNIENCAFGKDALGLATNISLTVAIGAGALASITSGSSNTAVGYQTLNFLDSGSTNTAIGYQALYGLNNLGSGNTAVGTGAGKNLDTGNQNCLIGLAAGSQYTGSESQNICIASPGNPGENAVINIGDAAYSYNACYILGINGKTTGLTGTPVLVDSDGNLGTISSSERYKENITNMDNASSRIMNLRPVSFTYKERPNHGIQYGLIAEEVMDVFPELVQLGEKGMAEGVHYHVLPQLLLNEFQKLYKRVQLLEENKCQCNTVFE